MPKAFYKSLRVKAVVLMAFIVAAIAIICALYFSRNAEKLVLDFAFERIDTIGDNFAFNAEYGLLLKDKEILYKMAKGIAAQEGIKSAIVLDAEGKIIARAPQPPGAQAEALIQEVFKEITGISHKPLRKNLPEFGEVYLVAEPVRTEAQDQSAELGLFETENSQSRTIGYTVIFFSAEKVYRKIQQIQKGILALLGAFSLIIMLFIFVISNFFVKQLRRLLEAMGKIQKGDLTARVPISSRDELGEVAQGFNQMSEALEKTTVSRDALVKEIEERKRLEHMMLQSEKMSAIGQLAGGVAHEINNPLGVILGFAQNVAKRIQPGDPLELPLKSIEREAVRCKNLVHDLLTFSRVSKTEKEVVNLKEAIESALSLVLAQSKVKNVDLVKEIQEVPGIQANKTQIQQIIVNLSNNAIDAMPEGGRLVIRLGNAALDGREGVEIQVQDNGQGISPENRSKIFNPFFTTKEIGKGTGLGLSLVYEIVGKHSGVIQLDSEVGKGTTFKIFLPLKS